jgi:type VI secretion system protein ImpM
MPPATGFYGKIPSRGDFVRGGLPSGFVTAWDNWLQTVLPGARDILAEDWTGCWMEAPVWRFSLPPGQCGPDRVIGLWMPSVDAAGRQFPLTVALVLPDGDGGVPDDAEAEAWLDEAEAAGRDALEFDLTPAALGEALPAVPVLDASAEAELPPEHEPADTMFHETQGMWWSVGSPWVSAVCFGAVGLPDAARFALMLRDKPMLRDPPGVTEDAA